MEEDILVVAAMKMELPRCLNFFHTGFGKEKTRQRLTDLLKNKRPSLVISVGVVGAVAPELKAGDVFIPEKIIDYENINKQYTVEYPVNKSGVLVTVQKVFEMADKYGLKKRIADVSAVDMETSAVAEVLEPFGIPLLCIKGVCDELDFDFSDKKALSKNINLAIQNYTEYLWKIFPQLKK
jgi:nucleoside phosphorylase